MQKNLPGYTPGWIRRTQVWAERSRREITYALCDDERTLLWFANQRAVEYHPTLTRGRPAGPADHMVMDLDPPEGAGFAAVTAAAQLVRRALADAGMAGAVKTSGSKGVHVIIPVAGGTPLDEVAAATRALAARAERLDPELATTAFVKDRTGGQGLPRLDQGRRRDRGRRVQPTGAAGRAGVVPGRLGRAGRD